MLGQRRRQWPSIQPASGRVLARVIWEQSTTEDAEWRVARDSLRIQTSRYLNGRMLSQIWIIWIAWQDPAWPSRCPLAGSVVVMSPWTAVCYTLSGFCAVLNHGGSTFFLRVTRVREYQVPPSNLSFGICHAHMRLYNTQLSLCY